MAICSICRYKFVRSGPYCKKCQRREFKAAQRETRKFRRSQRLLDWAKNLASKLKQ